MNAARIIGLVLVAVGIILIVLGLTATRGMTEEIRQEVTGQYSDRTVGYIIAGIACLVGGGALALFGGRLGGHSHHPTATT